jgi:hypothetical protein
MREQVVDLVLNPRLTARIPAGARRAVDSTRALMNAGRFIVPAMTTSERR